MKMGLDMYLERSKKIESITPDTLHRIDFDVMKKEMPNLFEAFSAEGLIVQRGDPELFQWYAPSEEVGYWRKANAIHQWFVKHCQNGQDNCEVTEVPKEKLEELLALCRRIKMLIENSGAEVEETEMERVVGYSQGKELTEKIRSYPPNIVNQLKSLLPTQSGFFFGGTEYDEYYIQNIYDTIEMLEKVLAETNFDTHIITYHSSW